jgi:hypothetical protein
MQKPQTIPGRTVTDEDVALVRDLIGTHPDWHRTRVSRELCERWSWTDEAGRQKDMACRTLLLKLERRGLIGLPRRRGPSANHRRGLAFRPVPHETVPIGDPLRELLPIRLVPAESGPERQLWQTLLAAYHFRGTCYRAANWLPVGETAGRSRNDVRHRLRVPAKAAYVRPLCRDFRARLMEEP